MSFLENVYNLGETKQTLTPMKRNGTETSQFNATGKIKMEERTTKYALLSNNAVYHIAKISDL
jgi:hypothetical protein